MEKDTLILGEKANLKREKQDTEVRENEFNGEDMVTLPVSALKKHVSILGATGSGKTVLGKVLVEEAVVNEVPSIIIDPQGDLSSLGITAKKGEVEANGSSPVSYANFKNMAEVRIFTPASKKGIPLSVNPLKTPQSSLSKEELIKTLDLMCLGIIGLAGYKPDSSQGRAAKNYLFTFLKKAWEKNTVIEKFSRLAEIILKPELVGIENTESLISSGELRKLSKNLNYLSVGMEQLIFNFGVPMETEAFLTPVTKGKVPVNVIFLNSLNSDEQKNFFVAMLAKEIYSHMLQHPSPDVRLLFLIDEIAPFLPPHPRNPPAKEMLKLLFKQGRKFGVSCVMATQNPADVDYKAMAQASTWAFGRMMAKQDLEKIKHILRNTMQSNQRNLLRKLPSLNPGEFLLISPDNFQEPRNFNVRYLFSKHETLDEDRINSITNKETREYFKKFVEKAGKIKSGDSKVETAGKPGMHGDEEELFRIGSQLNIRELPVDAILIPEISISQNQAIRIAEKKLDSAFFIFKKELIEEVNLRYVPIWKAVYSTEKYAGWIKIPVVGKKEGVTRNVYFSGETGKLLDIDDKLRFSDLNTKNPAKLDHFREIPLTVKRLNELDAEQPSFTKSEKQIISKMETKFGIPPEKVQKMALPVWEFSIKEKKFKQRRKILIDTVFGKEVQPK